MRFPALKWGRSLLLSASHERWISQSLSSSSVPVLPSANEIWLQDQVPAYNAAILDAFFEM